MKRRNLFPSLALCTLFGIAQVHPMATTAAEALPGGVHPGTDIHLPDTRQLRQQRVSEFQDAVTRTPLSDHRDLRTAERLEDPLRPTDRDVTAVQTVHIKPMLLDMPTAEEVDFGRPVSGVGVPRQFANLVLTIEGTEYHLRVVNVAVDPAHGLRHVTAQVQNVEDAFALFSVSATGQVTGTLKAGDRVYRILPGSGTEQIIYRLAQQPGRSVAPEDQRVVRRLASDTAAEAQQRHLQMLKVADLQFEFVTLRQNGHRFAARGGRLGAFNPETASHRELMDVLERLGALSNAARYRDFRIVERHPGFLRFEQLIAGIPVETRNEITTTANGRIDEVRIVLVDPARAPRAVAISEARAMQAAATAFLKHLGQASGEVEFLGRPRLTYTDAVKGAPLALVYTVAVRTRESAVMQAKVNALTSEVDIIDTRSFVREHSFNIYVTTSGAPQSRNDPGATLVVHAPFTEENGCVVPLSCFDNEVIETGMFAINLGRIWETVTTASDPELCCSRLGTDGERYVDIILKTPGAGTAAEYNGTTRTLLFRPIPSGANPATDWIPSRNGDTFVHEYAHHFQDAIGGMGHTDYSRMLKEGLADAMVGAVAQYVIAHPTPIDVFRMGQPWILGDGYAGQKPNGIRDMTAPKQFSWIDSVLSNVANPERFHDASLGISNFFYRLFQKGGISSDRLVELLLKIPTWLDDWNDSGDVDLNDFYFAVDKSIRAEETTLRTHVNQVWLEMNGTIPTEGGPDEPPPGGGPGGGGPGGLPPAAPISVNGSPLLCDRGIGWHNVSWTPMPSVGNYRTYVGPFEDVFPGSVTSAYAWSNFNTEFRVRSCNAYGCSGISADNYVMNYSALCAGW